MKISKHLHSCLLAEDQGKTVLIDPGTFTYREKALDIDKLTNLDYILITHEHEDHMSIPLIKELFTKFPRITLITNPSAATILKGEGIHAETTGTEQIQIYDVPHERLWDVATPQNSFFKIFNKLTHPGDSHHFDRINEILALPITAPWGSTTDAINLAIRLKPKIIIPIHDWIWKDEIRRGMYQRLVTYAAKEGIEFKPIETGEVIEI